VRRIGILLITNFVELRVIAEEIELGQVGHRPSLDGRAVELRRTALSEHGMGAAWHV
jgi:hypothetical protein